jgi:hypothetical protein
MIDRRMIQVECGSCGQIFEVGDELAGLSEFCPACGALNDIPPLDQEDSPPPVEAEISPAATDALASSAPAPLARGIPSVLWWTLVVGGVAAFVIACVFLFSDNWESQHVRDLSDAANRGDALLAQDDFAAAQKQYDHVLQTVGTRAIQSTYIRQLLRHARAGQIAAQSGLRAAPATAPATAPTSRPAFDTQVAIKNFQRDSEGFAQFIRTRPMLYQDAGGQWRRRQLVVWDAAYEQQAGADPPQMLLRYSCVARLTEPHPDRPSAADDPDFVKDEPPGVVHCQTLFELRDSQWHVANRQIEGGHSAPSGLISLEGQAFHVSGAQPPAR